MNIDEIKLMYEYNFWANKRILNACANVSADQYAADTPYGNLRATMTHLMEAEFMWQTAFQNYMGEGEAQVWDIPDITAEDVPTVDALSARWQSEERAFRSYLDGLTDADLSRLVRYQIPGGIVRERVLWHCLLHVVNHGTQHRSEAAALLTSYGQSPGGMDMTLFLNEYFNLPSPP
jgi:uncharacterized damage-inducible protein DinB